MPFPFLTAEILNDIPRRIRDKDGNPGDMVNFVILGSEVRLKRAFQLGGWILVDRTKTDAVIHGLISTLSKEEYVEMPMSELYLFGRPQDFGYRACRSLRGGGDAASSASLANRKLKLARAALGGRRDA